ncbi:MAG: hypothetical protein MK165_20580, partial [Pirellulaceae bacterium]|nr:hypothetical protein [Pirellulaceae bacterium]
FDCYADHKYPGKTFGAPPLATPFWPFNIGEVPCEILFCCCWGLCLPARSPTPRHKRERAFAKRAIPATENARVIILPKTLNLGIVTMAARPANPLDPSLLDCSTTVTIPLAVANKTAAAIHRTIVAAKRLSHVGLGAVWDATSPTFYQTF